MAKEALTPPVVGSVSTAMKGRPASFTMRTAMMVRGICIRLSVPSCMRAPPEAVKMTRAASCSTARRAAATMPSPTAGPMEPPMNSNDIAATTALWPPTRPCATTMASSSPVFSRASRRRSA